MALRPTRLGQTSGEFERVFGFGKKRDKPPSDDGRVNLLLSEFQKLNEEVWAIYEDFERFSPPEIHLFSMAAVNVYLQSYATLPPEDMQQTVNKFLEGAVAITLSKMPKADFSMLFNAARDRFSEYANLIVEATDGDDQSSVMSLVAAMDVHIKVQRDALDQTMAGMKLLMPLTNCAVAVRDAFAAR